MFEVGKLSDESMDSLLQELEKVGDLELILDLLWLEIKILLAKIQFLFYKSLVLCFLQNHHSKNVEINLSSLFKNYTEPAEGRQLYSSTTIQG